MPTIESQLTGKTEQQQTDMKVAAAVDNVSTGIYDSKQYGVRLDIQSVKPIDKGIEIMARAWKDGEQMGFGEDGSVDIERFRIFNPPLLVDDPNGNIVFSSTDGDGNVRERRLSENPGKAVCETLAHTAKVAGKMGSEAKKGIEIGKVGTTTDTYFPSGTNADGSIRKGGAVYATTNSAATGDSTDTTAFVACYNRSDAVGDYAIRRFLSPFDTSAIADTDVVSSATYSLYGGAKNDGEGDSIRVVTTTQASGTALATGDFSLMGTTAKSSDVTISSISTTGYQDFALNDMTIISLTGYTKLGVRNVRDCTATAPANGFNNEWDVYTSAQAGTDHDPKLVVVHAPPASGVKLLALLGVG